MNGKRNPATHLGAQEVFPFRKGGPSVVKSCATKDQGASRVIFQFSSIKQQNSISRYDFIFSQLDSD